MSWLIHKHCTEGYNSPYFTCCRCGRKMAGVALGAALSVTTVRRLFATAIYLLEKEIFLYYFIFCVFSGTFQRNIWENISVSVSKGFMNNNNTMLSWKVSAPCKVDGEVWACERTPGPYSCTNIKGFKQRLAAGSWRQDNKGFWVRKTPVLKHFIGV